MNLRLNDRKSGAALWFPGMVFEVESLRWDLLGGPAEARVTARPAAVPGSAAVARLGQLTQLLRCPATIVDESGAPCWWGYVHQIDLTLSEQLCLTLSLDSLYNRVAVRYRDERLTPEVTSGWQFQTAWLQDALSIGEYGKKEGIFALPPGFPAEAAAYALSQLARSKRPALEPRQASPGRHPSALLTLRGWWDTLAWQYFSETRGFAGFNGGGAAQPVGAAAAASSVCQSFTVGAAGWTAVSAWVKAARSGAPSDSLGLALRADSGGLPGAILSSAVVAGSSLSGDLAWTRFSLLGAALAAGATCWLEVLRTGGLDAANYYRTAVDEGLAFGAGALKLWNGSAWVGRSPDADLVFTLNGQSETTAQIKAVAESALGGGQFLRGAVILDASGVQARQYRDGKRSGQAEVRTLLGLGSSAGEAMQAYINPERWLVVRKVPANSTFAYWVQPDGELRDRSGARVIASMQPVGKWARVRGLEQAGGEVNSVGSVLLSRVEWRAGRLRAAL